MNALKNRFIGQPATMKKKLEFEYYYKMDTCTAKRSTDKECICWQDEGRGPYKNERHDAETPLVEWRIKPVRSNARNEGTPLAAVPLD